MAEGAPPPPIPTPRRGPPPLPRAQSSPPPPPPNVPVALDAIRRSPIDELLALIAGETDGADPKRRADLHARAALLTFCARSDFEKAVERVLRADHPLVAGLRLGAFLDGREPL